MLKVAEKSGANESTIKPSYNGEKPQSLQH
jgi:hypothetical protein